MARVSSPQCQGCGAPIRVETGLTVYDCRFCGRSNVLDSKGAVRAGAQPQQRPNAAAFVAIGIALAMGLVGSLFFLTVKAPSSPGFVGGSFQWDGTAAPVFVDTEDESLIIGRIRRDGEMYVAAFDAVSLAMKWETTSLGEWVERHQQTFIAAGPAGVAITHPDRTVTIHGLSDGEIRSVVALSDRAIGVCRRSDEPSSVWIAVADLQDVALHLGSASLEPTSLPDGCEDPRDFFSDCRPPPRHGAACAEGGRDIPERAGASLSSALILDDEGVAQGYRSPGTATPVLVGFDPSDRSVRWTRWLHELHPNVRPHGVELVELALGRYYVEYGLEDQTRRLASFDARTGTMIFDIAYPDSDKVTSASAILVHGDRVYMPRWTWLHIFDVQTGTHISTLGHWM